MHTYQYLCHKTGCSCTPISNVSRDRLFLHTCQYMCHKTGCSCTPVSTCDTRQAVPAHLSVHVSRGRLFLHTCQYMCHEAGCSCTPVSTCDMRQLFLQASAHVVMTGYFCMPQSVRIVRQVASAHLSEHVLRQVVQHTSIITHKR